MRFTGDCCVLDSEFRQTAGFFSLIVAYAPTENADTSVKEQFYAELEVAIAQCGKNDLKVILDDFNAVTASQAVAEYRATQHYASGGAAFQM